MGGKQAKGRPRAGAAQAPNRDHLHPPGGQRAEGRGGAPAPYQRRIGLIHDMAILAKQGRQQEAAQLLRSLRQDLGMESTSLDDVLCRYASFRNLVDPITHELIVSLARYIHCPKPEGDAAGGLEKICRQLTHHLSPHSRCKRQGLLKRKPQACLKAVLSASGPSESLDLSGIALSGRDLQRVALYLRESWETLCSVELGFVELTDEGFLQLLPTLASLPSLCTLSLNGNKLTRAVLRELTDTLKDLDKFPSISWIDLGNNVDIYSLPQPFLVSLRRRCPKHSNLPTILEFAESQSSDPEDIETERCSRLERGTAPGLESGTLLALEQGTAPGLEQGTAPGLGSGTLLALEPGTAPGLESGTLPALELETVPALELGAVPELEQEVVPDVEPLLDVEDEGVVGAAGVMPGLT